MDLSKIDLSGFSPKDKKIIKDNQNVDSLHDLRLSGLSEKAIEKIVSQLSTQKEAEATPQKIKVNVGTPEVKKIVVQDKPLVPASTKRISVQQLQPPGKPSKGGRVAVYNKNTGRTQLLSEKAASLLVKPNQDIYSYV